MNRILSSISVISLLLGLWLGFGDTSIEHATAPAIAEALAENASSSAPKYKTVAIRDIQPAGYKVLADNPQTPGQAAGDFGEFNPKTWQVHRFLMNKPDGGWLKIGLARPVAWIEAVERNDSGQVWLEFDELGIADWATLQKTESCPSGILGEGRLVTGTFEHSSGEVLKLFISDEATPIGSTANHPFWSEDRQDFVQAGSLNPGEHLRLADGRTTTLERTEPIAEQLPVYNLEVDGEHVYFVGESGVLVHNAGTTYSWQENLRRMGLGTSSTGIKTNRVYTIYLDGKEVWKFGVTDAAGTRLAQSLREAAAKNPGRKISHSATGAMTKSESHLVEKYFRSLHEASTGGTPIHGMKRPYPITLKDLPEFQVP